MSMNSSNKLRLFRALIVAMATCWLASALAANDSPSLIKAAKDGDFRTVQALLANGINPNSRDENGDTALSYAANEGKRDVVELLLSKGADINAKNNNGFTPLMAAASGARNDDTLALLLSKGAVVNAKDKSGLTALTAATIAGNRAMVKLLVSKGADVNGKDNKGVTALMVAALEAGNSDIIKLLLSNGADVNARDNSGYTAMVFALNNGDRDEAELLRKAEGERQRQQATQPSQPAVQPASIFQIAAQKSSDNNDQVKLATVDVDRLLQDSAPAIAARKRLEAKHKEMDAKLKDSSRLGNFSELQKRLQEDLSIEQNKELTAVIDILNKEVRSLASRVGIDFLFQKPLDQVDVISDIGGKKPLSSVLQKANLRVQALDVTDYVLSLAQGRPIDENRLRSDLVAINARLRLVETERLLRESPPAKAAVTRLEAKFRDRDAELAKRSKREDTTALQKKFREDLDVEKNRELTAVQNVINKEIQSLASKEGLVVIDDAVYASPRLLLTDMVMQRLK